MVVCKFGGSSVADSSQIRKVAGILRSDSERRVAIVSAPGKRESSDIKITDMLYTCQRDAAAGRSIAENFDEIRKRYLDIAAELGIDSSELSQEIDEIEKRIVDGSSADYAASRGEYLGAKIIAAYMDWEFLDTEEHIILNNDGTVNERSYAALAEAIDVNKQYILPGFYGTTTTGEIKTFSRGGSDITGAIAARSMNAELYENWTDVSGIRMADPRIVENPEVVHELTYQEIREMASIGAGVFHEEAIAPVRSVRIPICVKNTNDPDAPGTMIVPERKDDSRKVVGVSGKAGYCRLYVRKMLLNKESDYELKIRTILKVHGIIPEFSSIGFDSVAFYFNQDELRNHNGLIERIQKELAPDEICTSERVAMIGIVGEGLYGTEGILGHVSSALAEAGIPIRYLNYGGSLITCILGVDDSEYTHALKVMYDSVVQHH